MLVCGEKLRANWRRLKLGLAETRDDNNSVEKVINLIFMCRTGLVVLVVSQGEQRKTQT